MLKGMKLLNTLEKLNIKLNSLVIFRNLLSDNVFKKLSDLLAAYDKNPLKQISLYSSFANSLFENNESLTDYTLNSVLQDENIYLLKRARNLPVSDNLQECLNNELLILQKISRLTSEKIKEYIAADCYLPDWETGDADFVSLYSDRADNISKYGFGIYSRYHVFTVKDGIIVPVKNPDNVKIADLYGYDSERKQVADNTLAFLNDKPAANVLLYGDAGTGKSTTVKAIVNEYKAQGLRLIEVSKNKLDEIPTIIEALSGNPLKFILFIDDLSFNKNNDAFGSLKSALEGSVSAKSPNLLIYATSNRRHLIKESFQDRDGDDIHINETIQELSSLSDRFGLTVSFFRPDKDRYLHIVHSLANRYDLKIGDEFLDSEAERYALKRGGRSPRIAKHLIEYLKSIE